MAGSGLIAVTGATGFVGQALCSALSSRQLPARVLVRAPHADRALPHDVETVSGSLDDAASLGALVEGADTVIHLAGVVSARRPEDFQRVNVDGTSRLVGVVAQEARPPRVLLVSSLAARSPETSPYAASKHGSEQAVVSSGLEHVIVRPPAVYGPRDRATLPIFQQLVRGWLLAPGPKGARFSLLHVDDLADLLCDLLARPAWRGEVIEPDDGRAGGYDWPDLAAIASPVVGRRIRCIRVPRTLVWCAAAVEEVNAVIRGRAPTLSRGKLDELWYPDWVARDRPAEALAGWTPRVGFADGAAKTLAWYRRQGWL